MGDPSGARQYSGCAAGLSVIRPAQTPVIGKGQFESAPGAGGASVIRTRTRTRPNRSDR